MIIEADDESKSPTGIRDSDERAADRVRGGREPLGTGGPRDPCTSTTPARPAALRGDVVGWRAGDRIDRYELIEQIGVGGMGVVWAARDVDLGREVALKLSFPDLHVRLLCEAQAMARLSHPNVVTIHDVGATPDGLFIAMERVDGGTLAEWLRALPRAWEEVVEAFVGAGRGLAAAHRAGLVHRDFKPENVLVGRDGVVRVSDFGLAMSVSEPWQTDAAEPGGIAGAFTQEGAPVGTLAYMAPEQLLGRPVSARTDQFSFCLTLHEALYGVSAFAAAWDEAPAVYFLAAVAEARISPPTRDRRLPARLRRLLVRGLCYQPEDRWPSMDSLVAELERCLDRSRLRPARRP